ncbi:MULTISPECIES: substrate-binding domain-containing protein [Sorangium]|uniref:XRE family transcriptional regulator n=1 Tax=Sorangium cellulosum TaxID=56 RepID=A0A4P2QI64_SORCE|nr:MULTISPECIES: substrate-binding domain-containing protein [Sorangium]AUX29600.1 XRE family transcriptional regulator [Sorangium cellulosum]WCQ88996.1 transcriptional regulator [Sorangium sp. Soce836]
MADRAANRVRERREARGLSQIALAERAGLTRQSVGAIEAGRATPAVDVALRIARALDGQVEDLFGAPGAAAAIAAELDAPAASGRAAVARIAGRWVAYPLDHDAARTAADGIVTGERRGKADVEPLRALAEVEDNVVVMGCAAGLGLLADRLNTRPGPGRFLWFPRSSTAALQALGRQRAHVAGVHLVDARTGEANVADVRNLGHAEPIALITLARWEAGLVVRREDAARIRGAVDLGRPGLRLVGREAGAGAQRLLEREVRGHGLPLDLARRPPLRAAGHLDVARAVAMGAADTGVATRDAAMAFGLGFVTLAEERYDLAIPRASLADARVQRLLDVLVSGAFRRELSVLGYDVRPAGERVAEVRAA